MTEYTAQKNDVCLKMKKEIITSKACRLGSKNSWWQLQ